MHGLFKRVAVILSCLALSVAATKVTSSIRRQATDTAITIQTPGEQTTPVAPNSIVREKSSVPESLSPYDIRNFIDGEMQLDLRPLWKQLKIRTLNFSRSHEFDPTKYPFLESCSYCQAETFEYELDGQPGSETLLKISENIGRSCRYLIFSSSDSNRWGEWKLIGHIDSEGNKYRASQHKIFMGSGSRSWLVISSQGASGTGVASYYDRVFLVSGSRVHEVLSYVSEGHQSDWPSKDSREFFGQLVSCELQGDLVTAEIVNTVQYFGEDYLAGGSGILLWEKRQKAVVTSRLGQSEQLLDVSRSTLSERELQEVYNIDSLTEEGYFEYNAEELSGIARGKDAGKREWLRRSLAEGEETAGKRRLRRLLAGVNSKSRRA